jgi:hypothetical protein
MDSFDDLKRQKDDLEAKQFCPNCESLKAELAEALASFDAADCATVCHPVRDLKVANAALRRALEVVQAHYDCYTHPEVVKAVNSALAQPESKKEG